MNAGSEVGHNSWNKGSTNTSFDSNDTMIGPKMRVLYGKDISVFGLDSVTINYLKVPARIRLTPEQVDSTEDYSQILEFPEYVCREIIKEIVALLLLHTDNPKLAYYNQVNQAIPQAPVNQQEQK